MNRKPDKTEHFPFPVVFFSKVKELREGTPEEILKAFRKSGKLNVLYHAQIHGNETASGEGALAIVKKLSKELGNYLGRNRGNPLCEISLEKKRAGTV